MKLPTTAGRSRTMKKLREDNVCLGYGNKRPQYDEDMECVEELLSCKIRAPKTPNHRYGSTEGTVAKEECTSVYQHREVEGSIAPSVTA